MLKFVRLDLGSRSHGLRPILLPTFFYAVRSLGWGEIVSAWKVDRELSGQHRALFISPPLLYIMQGQIRKVVDTGSVSTAQVMVLNELRMLCVWMGCQIGLLSGKHAHVITSTNFVASIVNVKHALHRKKFYSSGIKLVGVGPFPFTLPAIHLPAFCTHPTIACCLCPPSVPLRLSCWSPCAPCSRFPLTCTRLPSTCSFC